MCYPGSGPSHALARRRYVFGPTGVEHRLDMRVPPLSVVHQTDSDMLAVMTPRHRARVLSALGAPCEALPALTTTDTVSVSLESAVEEFVTVRAAVCPAFVADLGTLVDSGIHWQQSEATTIHTACLRASLRQLLLSWGW